MKPKKQKFTVIDYTLEQFFAEQKNRQLIINTLEKMSSVIEKLESSLILQDKKIKQLEKRIGKK